MCVRVGLGVGVRVSLGAVGARFHVHGHVHILQAWMCLQQVHHLTQLHTASTLCVLFGWLVALPCCAVLDLQDGGRGGPGQEPAGACAAGHVGKGQEDQHVWRTCSAAAAGGQEPVSEPVVQPVVLTLRRPSMQLVGVQ